MRPAKVPDDTEIIKRNAYHQMPQTDNKDMQ